MKNSLNKLKFTVVSRPQTTVLVNSEIEKCKKKFVNSQDDETIPKKNQKKITYVISSSRFLDSTDNQEKDANYATNFFEKVEETFTDNNDLEINNTFKQILIDFDPVHDKVSDLYHKIENLFQQDYPELVDLFLTFLLPGQAAEIGKFFDHFMLANMNTFFNKLNIYFNKQPAHVRKIYNCLNQFINDPNVTMDRVKANIFPLLKGNPLLIRWFLEMFPKEKPGVSHLDEYEIMSSCKKSSFEVENTDIYEEIHLSDMKSFEDHNNSCLTKYNNGRIIYCRDNTAIPTKLSFLANNATEKCELDIHRLLSSLKCVHKISKYAELKLQDLKESSTTDNLSSDDPKCEDDSSSSDNFIKKDLELSPTLSENNVHDVKLCNKETLRAHAIRLNPIVYATKDERYSDVLTLLMPTSSCIDKTIVKPLSPIKKNSNKLPASLSSEKLTASRPLKPTSTSTEDLIIVDLNVPNSSPIISSTSTTNSKEIEVENIGDSNYKMESTLKRARSSDSSPSSNEKDDSCTEEKKRKQKKLKKRRLSLKTKNCLAIADSTSTHTLSPIDAIKEENISMPVLESTATTAVAKSNTPVELVRDSIWTREEDKVILEEIRNSFDDSLTELFNRIMKELPERPLDEITMRYTFLMDVLKKFQRSD